MNKISSVRLLVAAGALMLLAGCIFGFTQQWPCAVLVWVGAFGCLMAALNFKNRKDRQKHTDGNCEIEKISMKTQRVNFMKKKEG